MIPSDINRELLAAAVEAARRALRRMDDTHIPAKLRGIAGRSGRLPAPLAKRMVAELDASEWLRAEALIEMEEEAGPVPGKKSVSRLFLERPEHWEQEIETIVSHLHEATEKSQLQRVESELRRALARAGKLEERLANAERKEQGLTGGLEERLATAAVSHKRSQARLKAAGALITGQLAAAAEEVARLMAENSDLRREALKWVQGGTQVDQGGTKAGSEERRAASSLESADRATPKKRPVKVAWSLGKPVDLARQLDDIARVFMVAPAPTEQSFPAMERTRFSGPPVGIRPDQAEAIVWLLSLPGPVNVAIDGWNAAHLLKSPPQAATRNRIIEAARRINLASSGKRFVTTVFDSTQIGETFSEDEVVVMFVPSADEELIEMAKRNAGRMVVITSDRRVREAVERAGAVGLWSEALIDWLRTAGRRTFSGS